MVTVYHGTAYAHHDSIYDAWRLLARVALADGRPAEALRCSDAFQALLMP